MSFKEIVCAVVVAGGVSAAWSADVNVDAMNGVIPNDPTVNVYVTEPVKYGSGMTLEADATAINALVQEQSTVEATVLFDPGQQLKLGSASIPNGAQSLILSASQGVGDVAAKDGALSVNVEEARRYVRFNASFTNSVATMTQSGAGSVQMKSNVRMTVKNGGAGATTYAAGANSCELTVSGSGITYDIASSRGLADFGDTSWSSTSGTTNGPIAVYSTDSTFPLDRFLVVDGSYVKLKNASFLQAEASEAVENTTASAVADCVTVGSNSVGVLSMAGSSLYAKAQVGCGSGSGSLGALMMSGASSLTNVASVAGECLFGSSGFAYVGVSDNSSLSIFGRWAGGYNGQFGLRVSSGAEFVNDGNENLAGGFSLGGANGDVEVYVGSNGVFRANRAGAAVSLPANANVKGVQMTADNGSIDLGSATLALGDKSIVNVLASGRIDAACLARTNKAVTSFVQFNGGVFAPSADGEILVGAAYVHTGGVEVAVCEGRSVIVGDKGGFQAPLNKGLESISVWPELAEKVFLAPPVVRITGDGYGATAVCELDPETGHVASFRITGRGVGYHTEATVSVLYGEEQFSQSTASDYVWLSDNVSGGLLKSGDGTLSLTGQSSNYGGPTEVRGGRLIVSNVMAIAQSSALRLTGGVFDLNGGEAKFADFGGDGTGVVTNGTVTLTGLVLDVAKVQSGSYETLNLTNVTFDANATVALSNTESADLDRSIDYPAYRFACDVPQKFPQVDPATYGKVDKGWGILVRDGFAYLHYYDGSLFIYY